MASDTNMTSVASTYLLTWKICIASWCKDWKAQEQNIDEMRQYYTKIPLVSNLVWNILGFVFMQILFISHAGFSEDFQRFCIWAVYVPELIGAFAYYCYKFGYSEVAVSLLDHLAFKGWVQNWITMQGTALVCLTQTSFFYFMGILLQPYILPSSWDWSVRFDTDLYEEYLKIATYFFLGMFTICLVTLPLTKHGYELSMAAAGRSSDAAKIGYFETFMELIYQTSQGHSSFFTTIPIVVLLQNYCGFRVYCLHVLFSTIEIVLFHRTSQYRFCINHQIFHEIQPLYQMTHIEHHICKGIHPTTSGVGLWEQWSVALSPFFTIAFGNVAIPYMLLQTAYMGVNIVVHTMWPSTKFLQYHTLHHTVHADVYNGNIPSPFDFEHSKSVSKMHEKLQEVSPFVRYENFSDLFQFALIVGSSAFLHYGLGMGLGHVDWSNRATWEYFQH